MHRLKRYEYNNKDEDNSLNTINAKKENNTFGGMLLHVVRASSSSLQANAYRMFWNYVKKYYL